MKLLHLADLHIGKRVNEFNMIEDQRYILDQILQLITSHQVEAVMIAGDVYDKTQPSIEAVELLDEFLTSLTSLVPYVFIISGNHDSPERLGFGHRILKAKGLYIAGVFHGNLTKYTLEDQYGPLHIHMLPFLKPAMVRSYYEEPIESYDDAVRVVISHSDINTKERNLLMAHQFVTSGGQEPSRSDSEAISIGGVDNVDASAFEPFDYVALGHLHGPQRIGRDTIRYSGSPLKYSFSEARQHKSVTLIDCGPKGELTYELIPLTPLREMREIKGPIEHLLTVGRANLENNEDYIHATLTDEDVYDAIGQLRQVYPNLMVLDFDNQKSSHHQTIIGDLSSDQLVSGKPIELFNQFYEIQNNAPLTTLQLEIMEEILNKVGGANL